MGESRQELLQWMNSLLQLNVTRVEQCGTGSALCQIFDSVWLDIPMNRVKFSVNTEYMYIQNFKILQNAFTKHGVDRTIPIEALVKCKMQDNLEFLQWSKRYWDQHFPGIEYDAVARRKAAGGGGGSAMGAIGGGPPSFARSTNSAASARRPAGGVAAKPRLGSGAGGTAASAALQQENSALKETVAGLERERDFYFNKLRDIELLLQQEVELHPELEQEENGLVARMQAILYSTEEGFEIPAEGEEGAVAAEEETF